MATSMKFRGNVLTTGSLNATNLTATNSKIGSTGNILTKLLTGSLIVTSPSFAALTTGSSLKVAHSPIANVAAGDLVFVQAGSLGLNIIAAGASATAASTITVQWQTTGCTAVAENALVTLQYLVLKK